MSVPESSIGGVKAASLLLAVVLYAGAFHFAFLAWRSGQSGVTEQRAGPRGAVVMEVVERASEPEKFAQVIGSQWFMAGICAIAGLIPATFFRRLRN